MADDVVIRTKGLTKVYGDVEALKGVDLTVRRNSIFGFLGPNGAGKTTLMKLLLGLIRPTAGGGAIFGLDIVGDTTEVRTRVGYLPQDPRFREHMTARQTLHFTARFYFSGPQKALDRRVDEMLDLSGLMEKADRPIKGFSGGERQRLGIAQAQVSHPDLLILDEPAASLDPIGRNDVLSLMERLREQATIFYSTHILDDVQRVSDTVAILDQGRLVAHGPVEALLSGGDGTVYEVKLEGDGTAARQRIAQYAWVSAIEERKRGRETVWLISVTDDQVAKERLLVQLVAEERLLVTEFRRRSLELEDVFMSIVGGSENGRQ